MQFKCHQSERLTHLEVRCLPFAQNRSQGALKLHIGHEQLMLGRSVAQHCLLPMHEHTDLHLGLRSIAMAENALHDAEKWQRGVLVIVFKLNDIPEGERHIPNGGGVECLGLGRWEVRGKRLVDGVRELDLFALQRGANCGMTASRKPILLDARRSPCLDAGMAESRYNTVHVAKERRCLEAVNDKHAAEFDGCTVPCWTCPCASCQLPPWTVVWQSQ
jgi:hypothetical protein